MNKQTKTLFIVLIAGTILFDYLFWKENSGINTLIFDILLFTGLVITGFRPWKSGIQAVISIALLLTAIGWHSSVFTIIMHYISLILLIGLVHQEGLNSIVFIVSSAFAALFKFPAALAAKLPKKEMLKFNKILKYIKLSLIPFLILWIFYLIYKNANPVFGKLSFQFIQMLADFISPLFRNISFGHICFILLGFGLTAWMFFKSDMAYLLINQSKMLEMLVRRRKKSSPAEKQSYQQLAQKSPQYFRKKFHLSMKLRYEFISALVLLVFVNVLLLIVNIIDINWVWFGFEYSEKFNMKQFVHEGTYLLIISILLSMGIMIYFFRRNQNFYSRAKILKILTYCWIIQNLILSVSVFIRNFLYIGYWGLAYKRIGVILFLIAVIYGLYSLFIKIHYKKTAYFLIKKNSFAVFTILLIASLFNWDIIIAKHNLGHPFKNHMETSYLLTLSDKALPLIDQNDKVLEQDTRFNTYATFNPYTYRQYYQIRIDKFIKNYKKRSWKSWNYAEWKAYSYYNENFKQKALK